MLRKVLVLGFVFALVAAVVGSAAAPTVEGGTIQAGSDTDLRCDTDGVAVDGWGLETDNGLVYFVRIHNISPACECCDIFVNITDGGVKVAGGSAHIPADGDADDNDPDADQVGVKINFDPPVSAEDITDIEVFIEGQCHP
jgi:hypothetical protein